MEDMTRFMIEHYYHYCHVGSFITPKSRTLAASASLFDKFPADWTAKSTSLTLRSSYSELLQKSQVQPSICYLPLSPAFIIRPSITIMMVGVECLAQFPSPQLWISPFFLQRMGSGGHILVRTKRDWIDFFPMLEVEMSRYLGWDACVESNISGHIVEQATLCLGEVSGLKLPSNVVCTCLHILGVLALTNDDF